MRFKFVLLALLIWGAWQYFANRPIEHGPGEIAPRDPVQSSGPSMGPFAFGEYQITPMADFHVEARVLGKERYHMGREAELSPLDLALGWGRMSDSAVLARLDISQSNRFYFYHWQDQPPIPLSEIISHSANMHMIPADDTVRGYLLEVREGEVVDIEGYLVQIQAPDGWQWKSSMTRADSGNGACELIWVKQVYKRQG